MESVIENSMIIAGISAKIDDHTSSNKQIQALWDQFWKENITNQLTNRTNLTIYAVYHDYTSDNTKTCTLTIGHRISLIDHISTHLKIIVIPQQSYQVFTAHGQLPASIDATWKKICQSSLQRTYTVDFEIYDERAQNPQDAIVDIYVAVSQ